MQRRLAVGIGSIRIRAGGKEKPNKPLVRLHAHGGQIRGKVHLILQQKSGSGLQLIDLLRRGALLECGQEALHVLIEVIGVQITQHFPQFIGRDAGALLLVNGYTVPLCFGVHGGIIQKKHRVGEKKACGR